MSDQILGLIIPGMSLLFAAGAFALWLDDRDKTYLLGLVVAPLALGTSLTINHYIPTLDAALVRFVSHSLSMIACIAFGWAVCTRLSRPVPLRLWFTMVPVVAAICIAEFFSGGFLAGFFIINSACGVIFVMTAQQLAQSGSREFVDRAMVIVVSLVAIQFFIRPAVVVMFDVPLTVQEYRESAGHALLLVSGAILPLVMAIAALAAIIYDRFGEVQERSQSDVLTGLPLRRAFEEDAHAILIESEAETAPVSLIVADIDHFKQVNDLWGHLAGDRAIASFGKLIGQTIRDTDRAGRIGGEEFCILVRNCTEQQASRLAERLRRAFATMEHEGIASDIRLTASFGVTQVKHAETYDRAFARADRALYKAKEAGRDRVETGKGAPRAVPSAEPLSSARETRAA